MGKIVDCAKVDSSTGCSHVVRSENEEELMKNAAEHAREHGIVEVTPQLMERVRANIEDEETESHVQSANCHSERAG